MNTIIKEEQKMNENYRIGSVQPEWGKGRAQTLTFVVTEDCNLRCKYCYITHKSNGKVLKLKTAKKFIDYILETDSINKSDAVILDFIGGEPFLEPKLIEDICDYFKIKTYLKGISWYWNYRINISTNGVNYSDEKVQHFIGKNKGKLSVGITLDGTKKKHDLQRVFPDGTGSYDAIHNNIELWLSQFYGSTKVTFSSEDLKYLKESVVHLWNEGIEEVNANVVYENVWQSGDDKIFEMELKKLADYILDNNLYNKYQCTLFADYIGQPYDEEMLTQTSCGAGKMLALSPGGKIYPCMRYYDYSLNHKPGYVIGNVDEGIDFEKSRVFMLLMYKYQCDSECLNCPIAQGCEFCQGFNYDEAVTDTNFQRAKYICKMHKARVRANNYYFAKLYHEKNIRRFGFKWQKEMLFVLSEDSVSICTERKVEKRMNCDMSGETVKKGLIYAQENFYKPIFLHSLNDTIGEYNDVEIMHYIPIERYNEEISYFDYRVVISIDSLEYVNRLSNQDVVILNLLPEEINRLADAIKCLLMKTDRIQINIQNYTSDFDFEQYEEQLNQCIDSLIKIYEKTGKIKEISNITDLLFIDKHEGCNAGNNSITYAPDGKLYICPMYYFDREKAVGDIENGYQILNEQLFTEEYMPLCENCKAFQCENCKYMNKIFTKEVNISPSFQCKKAFVEMKISKKLQQKLEGKINFLQDIEQYEISDPICLVKGYDKDLSYYRNGE